MKYSPIFAALLIFGISFLCPLQSLKPATPTLPAKTSTPIRYISATAQPTKTSTPKPTDTPLPSPTPLPAFSFILASDMTARAGPGEFDKPQFFRGACEAIAELGKGAFMILPGDGGPFPDTEWTINKYLGADYPWFPLVGNHDLDGPAIRWLRGFNRDSNGIAPPNLVRDGPPGCEKTTYSFDYANAHFALLNVYCDLNNETRTDGAIVDTLYYWLEQDLQTTKREHIFVIGHEPAFPQPDADIGLARHLDDSLDKYPRTRDRFWNLLRQRGVTAYITGHTHSFSAVNIAGVWQIDAGHAMGAREQAAPSTFVIISINGPQVTYAAYRASREGDYTLRHSGALIRGVEP